MDQEEFKLVRDNVHHGYIKISSLAAKVINTAVFKRLKGIHQLQALHEVFPTGNHTRFEHSLGTMHLARRLCETLGVGRRDTELVALAGLCHDLGHGPYSHLWEVFVRTANPGYVWEHEHSSFRMLLLAIEENPDIEIAEDDLTFIKELICGGDKDKAAQGEYPYSARGPDQFFLYEIISNKKTGIDVDKMDYMMRDAKALGINIKFDFEWFVDAGEPRLVSFPFSSSNPGLMVKRIAVREKVVKNTQNLFQDRTDLHYLAYQHRTKTVFDRMYLDVWSLADMFITVSGRDGAELALSKACQDEVALAKLTDDWIHQSIRNSSSEELAPARAVLKRIDQRKMYKIVGHIENPNLPGSSSLYEEALKKIIAQAKGSEAENKLEPTDIAITKVDINMGKGGRNPVENMLFYDKGTSEGYLKTSEQLRRFVPQQIIDQQLFVLVKDSTKVEEARAVVAQWARSMDWQVKIVPSC